MLIFNAVRCRARSLGCGILGTEFWFHHSLAPAASDESCVFHMCSVVCDACPALLIFPQEHTIIPFRAVPPGWQPLALWGHWALGIVLVPQKSLIFQLPSSLIHLTWNRKPVRFSFQKTFLRMTGIAEFINLVFFSYNFFWNINADQTFLMKIQHLNWEI